MTQHLTLQDKILHALRAVITDQQVEAVQQPVYANTGTLYAQQEFETLLAIEYRFNPRYMTLTVQGTAVLAEHLVDRPAAASLDVDQRGVTLSWHHLKYTEAEGITAMLAQLRRLLPSVPETTHPASDQNAADSAPIPPGEQLAARITADYPPDTHSGAWILLSERVHDHASRAASDINNRGHDAQIQYLLEHGDTEADIRELLDD